MGLGVVGCGLGVGRIGGLKLHLKQGETEPEERGHAVQQEQIEGPEPRVYVQRAEEGGHPPPVKCHKSKTLRPSTCVVLQNKYPAIQPLLQQLSRHLRGDST